MTEEEAEKYFRNIREAILEIEEYASGEAHLSFAVTHYVACLDAGEFMRLMDFLREWGWRAYSFSMPEEEFHSLSEIERRFATVVLIGKIGDYVRHEGERRLMERMGH